MMDMAFMSWKCVQPTERQAMSELDRKAEYFEGNLMPCGKCQDVYLCCYILNACHDEPTIHERSLPPQGERDE